MGDVNKEQMLERIRQLGVSDERVLGVVGEVDRKLFVPEEWRNEAYEDLPLPIGYGQTISQPYTVARMCELITEGTRHRGSGTRVMEIGTGSGWQACILAKLFGEVCSVEIIPQLSQRAKVMSYKLGVRNIKFKIGDGKEGWGEYASYDGIICGANAGEVPRAWLEQLATGGKIVCPVNGMMTGITKIIRNKDIRYQDEEFGEYSFVPLV